MHGLSEQWDGLFGSLNLHEQSLASAPESVAVSIFTSMKSLFEALPKIYIVFVLSSHKNRLWQGIINILHQDLQVHLP